MRLAGCLTIYLLVLTNSLFLSSGLGQASLSFQVRKDYPAGEGPLSIEIGDLNNDGNLDLAVSNFDGNSVSVLFGDGAGRFLTRNYGIADFTMPWSIAIEDLNGDGFLDLAVTCTESEWAPSLFPLAGVLVLLGTGGGAFHVDEFYFIKLFSSPDLAAGDLNEDGAIDLIAADSESLRASVLIGNGDGTFQDKIDYEAQAGEDPTLEDLNGDGHLDLAMGSIWTDKVSVLLGNGDGSFGSPTSYSVGKKPKSIAIGDLNEDGALDIVAGVAHLSTFLGVLLGNGDGSFQDPTTHTVDYLPESIALGDLDRDGSLDIAFGNYDTNMVSVSLGHGDGTFQSPLNFIAGDGPYSLAIGDLNGDSDPDMVTANYLSDNVSLFMNTASSPFVLLAPPSESGQTEPPRFEWTHGDYGVFLFYSVFSYSGYGYYPVSFWLEEPFTTMPFSWFESLSPDYPCYWAVVGIDTTNWGWDIAGPWWFNRME